MLKDSYEFSQLQVYDTATEAAQWAAKAVEAGYLKPDFLVQFAEMSTVWTITAETYVAKMYVKGRDLIAYGQGTGTPEEATMSWRPARDICRALSFEGFVVGCKQPGGDGLYVLNLEPPLKSLALAG